MTLAMPADTRAPWIAAAVLALWAAAIWLPALDTPFWGDDYVFLQGARAANLAGDPWWAPFWPDAPFKFWRPLSQESYWRILERGLDADVHAAHLASLTLLVFASACVGLLGLALARACAWPSPAAIGVLGGAVYGTLALHLLPAHWASAANSSILAALTALALAAWIAAPGAGRTVRALLLAAIPLLLTAALLSKESAALIPLLMGALSLLAAPRARPGRGEAAVWVLCLGVVGVWLVLHARFTAGTDPQYALALGGNLIRNGLSLVAWLLGVPREALRLAVSGETGLAVLWAAASALPMVAAWAIAARGLGRSLGPRQIAAALAFVALAYAPYFPLAWNSYAYYAAVAAMLPALLLARGLVGSRRAVAAALLIGLSSWVAVAGTRWLDHPGLIGRARWAELSFQALAGERIEPPLPVRPADPQRFYAMGAAGLAWRLGLEPGQVQVVSECPDPGPRCLAIGPEGQLSWEGPSPAPIPREAPGVPAPNRQREDPR